MKWWKKALIGTLILFVFAVGLAFALHLQILKTSENAKIEDIRDAKLARYCGEIVGASIVIIWFIARRKRDKK
jgi:hypothetical protein